MKASAPESDARPAKGLCVALEDGVGSYDVFISHSGPDVKTGFVGFLDKHLRRVGLHPFLDCISIGKGQGSWECIDHAIQTTPLALVFFSENFARSEWCLRELHAMLVCPSVTMLTIFYNVEPWEVKSLEEDQLVVGCKKLTEEHDETLIEEWRADLEQASTINGWVHRKDDPSLQVALVEEVVESLCELANKSLPLVVRDYIVGVEQVAENLIQTLDGKKVLMLGLWGMGGIGKTTLAQELYNQLGKTYDARCYVEDVAEEVKKFGVPSVQNYILKALCENVSMPITTNELQRKGIFEKRLSKK